MFYYLDGTVAEILPYLAVIDCGGVGYACKTTNTTLAQLKKGQRGKLYTYLDVGENQRIILELKDKMARESAATGLDFSGGAAVSVPAFTNKATEAAQALAVLGYTSAEVAQALKGVDVETLSLEEIIRQCLKKMVK